MSTLAASLADTDVQAPERTPKTPCFPIYGYGDQEDKDAVDKLRTYGASWATVQETVDSILEVEVPLPAHKFIRHWRAQCTCWK